MAPSANFIAVYIVQERGNNILQEKINSDWQSPNFM